MKNTGLRRWLVAVVVSAVVGAIIGAAALALRPTSYTSTAATSITVNSETADVSVLQGVTASLFMMMPVYAQQAQSDQVLAAAADASGLTREQVSAGLEVERSVDSSVLTWTLTAEDPAAPRAALNAATQRFGALLQEDGPKSGEGEPLLKLGVPPEASPADSGPFTPLVGGVAGGLIGLLGAVVAMLLLYRGRTATVTDWDELERLLGIPVAAELVGSPARVQRQWGYVADRLARSAGEGRIGIFGASSSVSAADATGLQSSLRRPGLLSPEVSPEGAILSSQGLDTQGLAGAVILLDPADTTLNEVAPDCRALARSVVGPVVGVLDRRKPAR